MAMKKVVTVESSQYPNEDFTGVLEDYFVKYVEQIDSKVLALLFENPDGTDNSMEITIYGIDYLTQENEAGELTAGKSFSMGQFNDSLNAQKVNFLFDPETDEVEFQPDLRGNTLDMDANPSKRITEDGEKTRQNWKIREVVGDLVTLEPKVPKAKPKPTPAVTNDDAKDSWESLIMSDEFFTTPHSHPEILRHLKETMPDAKERTPYTKSFKTVFAVLMDDGVLIMPEAGKYQYVE